jgi:hydrogenase expression/formation protein HypD
VKYIDEFRDGALAQTLAGKIAAAAADGRRYSLMEFCGGHTHAISRFGLADLLPENVRMVHGPGCPVCVLPIGRIDMAIELALEHGVILCTYGDTLRVPASAGLSLMKARAGVGERRADIRMVYSTLDALQIAREQPQREVVFFAIGFETTTPPTALAIQQAQREQLANFSVLCCHVLTPAAIRSILDSPAAGQPAAPSIDGIVGPAHVSTVIGTRPYEFVSTQYRKPVVIAGFEPLDVMQAILMLLRQLNEGRAEVENEFARAVSREGNLKAQQRMAEVFELRPEFEWRGLSLLADSALRIRPEYAGFDAERRFRLEYRAVPDNKACECGAILRGLKRPQDCRIFGSVCTPQNPVGACMVSSEGACAAHYSYGRYRDKD